MANRSVSHPPLIKPGVRVSRIRLSDWFHCKAHDGNPAAERRAPRKSPRGGISAFRDWESYAADAAGPQSAHPRVVPGGPSGSFVLSSIVLINIDRLPILPSDLGGMCGLIARYAA
jgi:hypothetical protein